MSKIWSCKIGEVDDVPHGTDMPMRHAVSEAYITTTGKKPIFLFSSWGAELTEPERAVVENREPSEDFRVNAPAARSRKQPLCGLEYCATWKHCEQFGCNSVTAASDHVSAVDEECHQLTLRIATMSKELATSFESERLALRNSERQRNVIENQAARIAEFDLCIHRVAEALGACCGGVDGDQTKEGATTRVLLEKITALKLQSQTRALSNTDALCWKRLLMKTHNDLSLAIEQSVSEVTAAQLDGM